ncbi:MAG TPA: hypothetical protein VK427_17795, partial [Kofleriaceae bacterium]|nr:hypothetical protein [Kofleriaceae bacterium]
CVTRAEMEYAEDMADALTDDEEMAWEDAHPDVVLTLRATRAAKTVKRRCGWSIEHVMLAIDSMLDELDASRRIFALVDRTWSRRSYLVITKAQRRALVAAGVTGVRAGPR